MNVIYLRTGLTTLRPERLRGRHADGLLLVFVVDDVDAEYVRLEAEGVEFTTPIETEPWGERYFQVSDPNGIVDSAGDVGRDAAAEAWARATVEAPGGGR